MLKIELHKEAYFINFIYLLKCLTGVIICYVLYKYFPQYPFYWSLISVAVSLSPDNSNSQAYDRMKANLIGCVAGICLFPLPFPNLVILCLGVALTILIGIAFRITNVLKTALAALVVIILQEDHHRHWYIALERVTCVVIGCVVALCVTLLFNLITAKRMKRNTPEESHPVTQKPAD